MTDPAAEPSDLPRPTGVRRAARSASRRASTRPRTPWRRAPGAGRGAPRGGRRALRPRRRTRSVPGMLGMTLLGAAVPGSGYLYAGRRALGALVLLGYLALLGGGLYYVAGRGTHEALELAFDPGRLRVAAAVVAVGFLTWAFVVVTSHRLVRPRQRRGWQTALGHTLVVGLCLAVAAPAFYTARNTLAQAGVVDEVLDDSDNESATTPEDVTPEDPWGGQDRVNVLLLGGDGGEDRTGVRTDTIMVLSINTSSGRSALFSLPRNMMDAQFPESSPLHDLYPDGFSGYGDDATYMLNAVYKTIPELHPGVLGKSDNEGADALKQAVGGSLGIPIHYYLLVNLRGFEQIVDAMGGVTVNINEPVAINGNTDLGIPPTGYLDPGPDQRLDGFHALWFARGRWGSDDYERMERQRCMVDAIIEEANPLNLFRRYQELAAAGEDVVYTDIPRDLAPAFVELALKVKDQPLRSVVFRNSEKFFSGDPDFDYVQTTVENTLRPPKRKPGGPAIEREAVKPVDVCAYAPVGDDDVTTASE